MFCHRSIFAKHVCATFEVLTTCCVAALAALAYCGAILRLKGIDHAQQFQQVLDPAGLVGRAAATMAALDNDQGMEAGAAGENGGEAAHADDAAPQAETALCLRSCSYLRQYMQLRYAQLTLWTETRAFP